MFSEMIFVHGFVHCDPHPGNVLVRKRSSSELWNLAMSRSAFGVIGAFMSSCLGLRKYNQVEIILLDHGLYQTFDEDFR